MSRFIASGAYGCIYYPPYDCKGKDLKDKSLVTKLVKNDYTSQTEYDISTLLNKEDGFLLIEKKCKISSTAIKQSMAKECDLIEKKDPYIEDKYLLLYSKYIKGTELVNFIKNDFTIQKIIKVLCFLCKQIELLIDYKVIHHDLHFGNIMYNYRTKQFVIIDFGLSIISSNFFIDNKLNYPYLKNAIFKYTPTWQYFAIEEHLLGYMIHEGDLTEEIIKRTINEYLDIHIIRDLSVEFCNKYIESSFKYFKKYINKPKEYIIRKFLSWWNTWDYFKISLHLIKIYIKMKISYPELYMFLLLMIHPIPKYRPNVIEVNNNIHTLLKNYSHSIDYEKHFSNQLSKELVVSISTI